MLAFRADGNDRIGSGHLMRCMSIAEECVRRGISCIFILADSISSTIVTARGFDYVVLETDFDDMDSEVNSLQKVIFSHQISVMIIDSYYVTREYLSCIQKLVGTCYIDDVGSMIYPVDVLVNYNINSYEFCYEQEYYKVGSNTKFILGIDYVPLRQEFCNIDEKCKKQVTKPVTDILITTGASDGRNVTGRLINAINRQNCFEDIRFHIVVGAYNVNSSRIDELARGNDRLIIYHNVTRMSEIMNKCDIAVSSGGSTMYELCACCVPMVCFTFADNQFGIAREFEKEKLAIYAGDDRMDIIEDSADKINHVYDGVINTLIQKLILLSDDDSLRSAIHNRLKERQLDKGTSRLVDEIIKALPCILDR